MKLSINAAPKGIPTGQAAVSPGVTDMGAAQATIHISALDAFEMPTVAAILRLSTEEARDLGRRLLETADKADTMALNQNRNKERSADR